MKRLFLIGGTMGIGKSTVSQILKRQLPNSVFLDGDWCWDSSPFQVTAETKEMVIQNICAVLNNFLKCSAYENVIFCWVMHEQSIIDQIVSCLNTRGSHVIAVSLIASEQELTQRLQKDVTAGIRTPDVIARSVQRIPLYQRLHTVKVDTSGKSAAEVAQEIAALSGDPAGAPAERTAAVSVAPQADFAAIGTERTQKNKK